MYVLLVMMRTTICGAAGDDRMHGHRGERALRGRHRPRAGGAANVQEPRATPEIPISRDVPGHKGFNNGSPTGEHIDATKTAPIEILTENCDWQYEKFSKKFGGASLQFYNSTEDWQEYRGYNMVPENAGSFSPKWMQVLHSEGRSWDTLDTTTYGSPVQAGRCAVPLEDGSTWVFNRIGPFRSTGNYDWWQFFWNDVFQAKGILEEYPDGIFVKASVSGAVDTEGAHLSFPPIHIHHVHVSPGEIGMFRQPFAECLLDGGARCSHFMHVVFEQHGDDECYGDEGGANCFFEEFENYAKLVTVPMSINAELNDVRPPSSPTLEWYYQVGMKYIPKVKVAPGPGALAPLSFHYMWNPGRLNPSDQSLMLMTYGAPSKEASLVWYTGEFKFTGQLLHGKAHTHNSFFDEAYLFSATLDQLGMDDERFKPAAQIFTPLVARDMGFEDMDDVKDHFFDHFNKNSKKMHSGRAPELICHSRGATFAADFPTGTYTFDRRSRMFCNNYTIEKGVQFVTIGFNKPVTKPLAPHQPHIIPDLLPGHLHWFLLTDRGDAESHLTYEVYTHDPEHSYGTWTSGNKHNVFGGWFDINLIVTAANKGTPNAAEASYILTCIGAVLSVVLLLSFFCFYQVTKYLRMGYKKLQ